VNAKNAFEVDINCLAKVVQAVKYRQTDKENQNSNRPKKTVTFGETEEIEGDPTWARTGEALGTGAKIYGLRVDNAHTHTYQVLNQMNRNGAMVVIEEGDEQMQEMDKNGEPSNKNKSKKKKMYIETENSGQATLDDPKNFTLT